MKNDLFLKRVDYYTDRVYYYQKILGLLGWEFTVQGIDDEDNRGSYYIHEWGRLASINYNIAWLKSELTAIQEIDKTAFHEVYELSLFQIREYLLKFYSLEFVDTMIHENVRRMENVLWPLIKDKTNE